MDLQAPIQPLPAQGVNRPQDEKLASQVIQASFHDLKLEIRAQGLIKSVRDYSGEGTRKFKAWVRDMERVGAALGADDDQKVIIALQTLKGPAGEYFTRLYGEHPEYDWIQNVQALKIRFSEDSDTYLSLHNLRTLEQKRGESIQSFADRIWTAAEDAYIGENMENPMIQNNLTDVLVNGVKSDSVARRLIKERPESFKAAVDSATTEQLATRSFEIRRRGHDKVEPMDTDILEKEVPYPADLAAEKIQKLECSVDVLLSKVSELAARTPQTPYETKPISQSPKPVSAPTYYRNASQSRDPTNPWRGAPPPNNKGSRPPNNNKSYPKTQYRWTADGRPICARCDIPGHKARDCKRKLPAKRLN